MPHAVGKGLRFSARSPGTRRHAHKRQIICDSAAVQTRSASRFLSRFLYALALKAAVSKEVLRFPFKLAPFHTSRSLFYPILGVDVGMGRDEPAHHIQIASAGCDKEWRGSILEAGNFAISRRLKRALLSFLGA